MKTLSGPFPLTVGVTGHNDLVDDAIVPVRAEVRRLLIEFQHTYPHTPVQVLTALAEGSDQLVADEAIALGLTLVAVLPMPLEDYKATFSTDAGRRHLQELWDKAKLQIELPRIAGLRQGEDAAIQYEHAGLVIARFSHVLLVLWNGLGRWRPDAAQAEQDSVRGGTAHIAYLHRTGGRESAVIGRSPVFPAAPTLLQPHDQGLAFRIATPRHKLPGCIGDIGSLWKLEANGDEVAADRVGVRSAEVLTSSDDSPDRVIERRKSTPWELAEQELTQIDKANALLVRNGESRIAALAQSSERLLPEEAVSHLNAQQQMALEPLRQAYAFADVFSQSNQQHVYRAIWGIVLALPAAVITFELYAHAKFGPVMLLLYLLIIFISGLFYVFFIKRLEWQNRFQDFRALAEALRVQLFWGLAGLSCSVAEFYLRKHHGEMNWIRRALLGPALQSLAVGLGPSHPDMVKTFWIDDQFTYFSGVAGTGDAPPGKAEQNRKIYKHCNLLANAIYFAGVGIGGVLLAADLMSDSLDEHVREMAIMSIGVAPALAAAISIAAEKRAYRDHAHQYSRMGRMFGLASTLLRRSASHIPQEFAAIVRDLGAEALVENGDWLLAHRERHIEPIKGG